MPDVPDSLPHGPLTKLADGVFCVAGSFRMGPGVMIGRTMTVLASDDGLVVLNAIRLSDEVQSELDVLGRVRHLIKLSDSHSIDEPFYADLYKPTVWSLPGADMGGLAVDRVFGPDGPIAGGVVVDYARTAGWRESAYWVPAAGGTLVPAMRSRIAPTWAGPFSVAS